MSYKTELATNNSDLEAVLAAVNNLPEAITVDSSLSSTSTNPVQNKVINSALAGKSDADHSHTEYAGSSHKHSASDITAGTFAAQVVANSSSQTPGTSLLRNSKLVSADTTPTVNGEICWTYK